MAITETGNADLACAVILWKVADALRSLTLGSQKRSAGAKTNETSESR